MPYFRRTLIVNNVVLQESEVRFGLTSRKLFSAG